MERERREARGAEEKRSEKEKRKEEKEGEEERGKEGAWTEGQGNSQCLKAMWTNRESRAQQRTVSVCFSNCVTVCVYVHSLLE